MRFRVLGPLTVEGEAGPVRVVWDRERCLLGVLLLSAGRVVPVDRMIYLLWAEDPPAGARSAVHTYMSRLRRALAGPRGTEPTVRVLRHGSGYKIDIDPLAVDLHRFSHLVEQARAHPDLARRSAVLVEALGLWRGPVLANLEPPAVRQRIVGQLDQLRLSAARSRCDIDLMLGRHADVVGDLAELAAEYPFDEGVVGQWMVALYRCGRRADALAAYRASRKLMIDELGLEPGDDLRRIHEAALRNDPGLDLVEPAAGADSDRSRAAELRSPAVEQSGEREGGPAQLPAAVPHFVGRAGELRALDGLLGVGSGVQVVAITGPAGVGKTGLALHWGHRVAHRFPDGHLFIDLRGFARARPTAPIDALGFLLRALGVPADSVPVELDAAAALFRTRMSRRRILLVLDNAETADQVRPLLPGEGDAVVVVTSRSSMAGLAATHGAQRVPLGTLDPAESRDLLVGLIGRDRAVAEPDAVTEIIGCCGHLPLALRLAAAHLGDDPRQPLAAYASAIRCTPLDALALEDDPSTGVRSTLDLSFGRLGQDDRRLFSLFGTFPGPSLSSGAVEELTLFSPGATPEGLRRLAAAALIQAVDQVRYSVHDLVRFYAAEQAERTIGQVDLRTARARLDSWYLRAARAAGRVAHPGTIHLTDHDDPAGHSPEFASPAEALAWLEAEEANLAAIIHEHASRPGPDLAWRLVDALQGYYWLSGRLLEWNSVAASALDAAVAADDPLGTAVAQIAFGGVQFRRNEYDQAVEHYERALTLSRQAGSLRGQLSALSRLGMVHWDAGRLGRATEHLTTALTIAREVGMVGSEATAQLHLGDVAYDMGQLHAAEGHYAEALDLYQRTANHVGEGCVIERLGLVGHATGNLDAAIDRLNAAIAIHEKTGFRSGLATTRGTLAEVHRDAGHYDLARQFAKQTVAAADDCEEPRMRGEAISILATIEGLIEPAADVVARHRQALALVSDVGYIKGELRIGLDLAHALAKSGNSAEATTHAEHARDLALARGLDVHLGQALTLLADLHVSAGHPGRGEELADQALAIHRRTGHRLGEARTLRTLGDAHRQSGRLTSAISLWQHGLALLTTIGSPEADDLQALLQDTDSASSRHSRRS